MAKAPTQPTRSIRDNITVNLHSKLTKFQSDQAVVVASNRQNNLAAIKAITAVSRAKTDTSYRNTITPETLKIYANAIETYASKKDIIPAGEDGKFSDEQKTKEFTPENLISFFSSELVNNVDSNDERKIIEGDIKKSIKEVYPDDNNGNETIPESIDNASKVINTSVTKDMILSMINSGEIDAASEAIENCQNPTEKIELTNLLEEQTGNNQEDLEKNAGRADTMRDPDWGHDKGDDDFKIQDGDIIQYLMKEVILASAAWAANKASGIAGTIILETGADIYNECLPGFRKARNKIDEGLEKGKENLKKSIKNFFKGSSLNDEEIKKRYDLLTNILEECSKNKARSEPFLIINDACGANEQFRDKITNLEKHLLVLDGDYILSYCNEGKNVNSPKTISCEKFDLPANEEEAKLYAKILGKNLEDFTSKTVNGKRLYTIGGKDYLKYLQKTFDDQTLEGMTCVLPNENPEDMKKWLHEYHQKTEEAVKTNNFSEVKRMQEEKPSYYIACTFGKEINLYNAQTEIFSETYAQFMLIEEFRKNPETNILSDPKKAKEFMDRSRLEAKAIFYGKHKERLDPSTSKSVPSIKFMIDQMNDLVSRSKEALDKGSKEKIENPYEEQKPKSEKESLSIIKAAEDTSLYDFLQGVKNNLVREEQELIRKHDENNEKRSNISRLKEKLNKDLNEKSTEGLLKGHTVKGLGRR